MYTDEFFHSLNQLSRHFSKALNEALVPLGLYAGQWPIIHRLKMVDECTQKELCDYFGMEAPTVTRTLARMEAAGWIIRVQGKDKREKNITLTKEALIEYENWLNAVKKLERGILTNVRTEDLKLVKQIFKQINDNLNQ